MRVLITGSTGELGREIGQAVERAGYAVRHSSRRPPPEGEPSGRDWVRLDLATGEGIEAAVSGIDAVLHAASDPLRPDAVDVSGTLRLAEAARAAGVRHLIYVSIVGVDQIPFGYYRRKLAAEQIVAASGVPYSILRATQFHSLVDQLLTTAARIPFVLPIPAEFRVQSVAPSEVAERLVWCLGEGPGGRLPDFGGPEVLTLDEAAEQWKEVRKVGKPVVSVPIPGRTAAALRMGRNTAPTGELGSIRWRDWLLSLNPAEPCTPSD